ncbi:MAG: thioesterase family protein [Acidimicrobiia bacterium]|nr:thioesterase family protein [Acidimicrobiia bacterium]
MGFRTATAVTETRPGTFEAEIHPGWDIAGNANGGYLTAMAARAMASVVDRPDPVSVTTHYLAPGRPGPVTVDAAAVRQGRTFATASAALHHDGRQILSLLGTFADLDAVDGPQQVDGGPPALPDPDECLPVVATDTFPPPFMGRVELRLHPDDAGFSRGTPSGVARMRGWFRFPDDEPVDTIGLLVASDAFPPTVFNAALPVAWTPTLELTVHVRARPAPGWLACVFTTRFVTGGFLEEDGEVWDATGTLVAQSRQLALVPRG